MTQRPDGRAAAAAEDPFPAFVSTVQPPALPLSAVDTLLDFSEAITRSTRPDDLLQRIADTAVDLLGLPWSLLMLRNPESGELRLVAAHGASLDLVPPVVTRPEESTVLGTLQQRRPFMLADYQGGPPLAPVWWEPLRRLGVRALLAVPLLAGDAFLGSLHVGAPAPRVFSPVEVALLERLARLAAQLLVHTRALSAAEQRAGALETMQEVARSLEATLDIDTVLSVLLQRAVDLTGATGGTLMLWDEAQQALVVRKGINAAAYEGQHLAPGEGLVGRAFATGRTQVENSYQQWDGATAVASADRLTNVLVVPLTRQSQPFGTIAVYSKVFKAFSAADTRLLTLFGSQAAVAIDNQVLYTTVLRQRSYLDSIIHALHDALVVYDRQGRVMLMNPAAAEVVGMAADIVGVDPEVMARDYNHYFRYRVEPLHDWATTFSAVLDKGRTLAAMTRIHSDPLRTMETFFTPYLDETGAIAGVISVSRDVSATQELERVRAELAVARQQEDFLSIAAHELRTPITAIRGYGDLLARRLPAGAVVTAREGRMLDSLRAQVGRLSGLVNDLLDVSRIQAGKIAFDVERVDLRTVVEAALASVRPVAGPREDDLLLQGDAEAVDCDPARLEQVFVNLLTNALKYSTAGPITCTVRRHDRWVRAAVNDHGVGIAPEDLPLLFDRFFRSRDVYAHQRGLGLGLYISRGIVEQHGGRIWAESVPGAGSTFLVELAAAPPAPPA